MELLLLYVKYFVTSQGEKNVIGNGVVDNSGVDVDRCCSQLAPQQRLGVWAEWRHWAGFNYCDCFVADGKVVMFL